eukprot:TRINITY_DN5556_c0_g1_i1.p3 TRINITY_DN5556_c0_g1~~TRINITY_DN5556_c0_g1_i1.p3  ORF type:complete len:158 (+),score=4.25 TRINITY_DN5556_c0_g1_i1:195-668(+)
MMPAPQESQHEAGLTSISDALQPEIPTLKKKKKDKKKKASKGVETLFRTTISNHMKLSEMADRKANLMISINTIIVSIIISAYARKFDAPDNLVIPSLLLLAVCLVTIIVSLIATNPTISPIKSGTVYQRSAQLTCCSSATIPSFLLMIIAISCVNY